MSDEKPTRPFRYISCFSGIEAASVAWEPLGWEPAAFCEIEPFPSAVLAKRFPDVPNLGDITKVNWDEWKDKDIDLIIGGSPCQSFSVAGKRLGLDDARGNLAIEFCRIIDTVRPTWFILENVAGLLSSDGGRDFGSLIELMGECGYGVSYRILDAQHFGVPQRRRRVFVVGHIRADWRHSAAVLFEQSSLQRNHSPTHGGESKEDARSSPEGFGERGSGDGKSPDTRRRVKTETYGIGGGQAAQWTNPAANLAPTLHCQSDCALVGHEVDDSAFAFVESMNHDSDGKARRQIRVKGDKTNTVGTTSQGGTTHATMVAQETDDPAAFAFNQGLTKNGKGILRQPVNITGDTTNTISTTQNPRNAATMVAQDMDPDAFAFVEGMNQAKDGSTRKQVNVKGDKTNSLSTHHDTSTNATMIAQAHPSGVDWDGELPIGIGGNQSNQQTVNSLMENKSPTLAVDARNAVAVPIPDTAFVLDGVNSNSMKSSNPDSGIHEESISPTLDTSAPTPAKNQGGLAILQEDSVLPIQIFTKGQNGTGVGQAGAPSYTLSEMGNEGIISIPNDEGDDVAAFTSVGDGRVFESKVHPTLSSSGGGQAGQGYPAVRQEGVPRQPAVAVAINDDHEGRLVGGDGSRTGTVLSQPHKYQSQILEKRDMIVRRLTPKECERLQGFPDDWTKIEWNGKSADDCPDGHRYKACGNSMAVPVIRWLGVRIQNVHNAIPEVPLPDDDDTLLADFKDGVAVGQKTMDSWFS